MKSELSAPHFHNEDAAFAFVEARFWPEGPVCPHCASVARAGRLQGKSPRPGLWKCYACRKQFTVRMRSIFESSHVPLHIWLQAIYLMCSSKKGISTRQLQRTFGGSMKTAWFLRYRIREAMKEVHRLFSGPLGGEGAVIEADETYVGPKASNKAFKRVAEKMLVMALVKRNGCVRSFHVPNVGTHNLRPIIARQAHTDSRFITDQASIYTGIGWHFIRHDTVLHDRKEYVRGDVHTNTVEGYSSILKRGITGIYQHVSEAHLGRYLAEFNFRYSHRVKLGINDVTRAEIMLKGAEGKRLTYETTCRAQAA